MNNSKSLEMILESLGERDVWVSFLGNGRWSVSLFPTPTGRRVLGDGNAHERAIRALEG